MRNAYAGTCFRCGAHVEADRGYFQSNTTRTKIKRGKFTAPVRLFPQAGKWLLRCIPCVGKGNDLLPTSPLLIQVTT